MLTHHFDTRGMVASSFAIQLQRVKIQHFCGSIKSEVVH